MSTETAKPEAHTWKYVRHNISSCTHCGLYLCLRCDRKMLSALAASRHECAEAAVVA